MRKGIDRIRRIRQGMLQRCENPKNKAYPNYGGRGITVCEEWHDSKKFIEWSMSNGYADNLTIDRIDNNKGYEPSNCRWSDNKGQANNQRRNNRITAFGIELNTQQWAELVGIDRKTIRQRISNGMTPEEAVTRPLMKNGEIFRYLKKIDGVDDRECFNGYVVKSLKRFSVTKVKLAEWLGITRASVLNKLSCKTDWKEKEKATIYRIFSKMEYLETNTEMLKRRYGRKETLCREH